MPFAAVLLCTQPAVADTQEHAVESKGRMIVVKITEDYNDTSMIRAECVIPRPQKAVWGVLADYDNLENVIPVVTSSRILREDGKEKILLQEGRAGMWFIKRGFSVTFRVEEVPMSYIGFDAFEGDFKTFKGTWQVAQKDEGTLVIHKVEIEPDFYVPKWALRRMARRLMFETIENVIGHCMDANDP